MSVARLGSKRARLPAFAVFGKQLLGRAHEMELPWDTAHKGGVRSEYYYRTYSFKCM